MKIMRKQQFPQEFWRGPGHFQTWLPRKTTAEVGEKERWRRRMEENGSS